MGVCESRTQQPRAQAGLSSSISRKNDVYLDVLLIGPGDSGKTTFKKQLVNIYQNTYDNIEYRASFKSTILSNIFDGTIEVLNQLNDENYLDLKELFKDHARCFPTELDPEIAKPLIDLIFNDKKFLAAVENATGEYQVQDCWRHFSQQLKNYPEWGGSESWIPSIQDCIRSRARTSGVVKTSIQCENLNIRFTDVGGQRPERKKWFNALEQFPIAIYLMALSEYDQTLFEDRSKNRLKESFELFEECMNSSWFQKSSLLIFFNKNDLFIEKFVKRRVPLNISGLFPNAPKGHDPQAAIDWIFNELNARRKPQGSTGRLVMHVMTATDSASVKEIFSVCRPVLVERHLKSSGFRPQ